MGGVGVTVLGRRGLARRTAAREEADTNELVETITEVVTEIFDDLLIEAMRNPEVRSVVLGLAVRKSLGKPPPRASAVKASRRR